MRSARGNMWSVWRQADLFLITTNASLRKDGALVMGRGIAREARDRFPGVDLAFGKAIAQTCGSGGRYGLLVSPRWPTAKLGAFQVKYNFSDEADPDLIAFSVEQLCAWCAAHPEKLVHLNYPGIGNGKLTQEVVAPIIERLPDKVTVWII